MALFIANLAFSASLISGAELGILSVSVFSAAAGIVLLLGWSFRRKRCETANGS